MNARPATIARATPRRILLLDGDYLRRRTITLASLELGIAVITEAGSVGAAQRLLQQQTFDAFILAHDEACAGLDLVTQIRARVTAAQGEAPIALVTNACTPSLITELKALAINNVIVTPTTVKRILQAIEGLFTCPTTLHP